MDIEELLKQQSAWIDQAQQAALQATRRGSGITPEDAGLERERVTRETEERISSLVARREATLKAFDLAIESARRTLQDLPPDTPPMRPTAKPPAKTAAKAAPTRAGTAKRPAAKRKPPARRGGG